MDPEEARDLSRLAGAVASTATSRVQEVHAAVARRVFTAVGPTGAPVRRAHDALTAGVYGSVRAALRGAAGLAALSAPAYAGTSSLRGTGRGDLALAILSGTHGDTVERVAPTLAVRMSLRSGGRDLPCEPAALRAAFPTARAGVALFLHGLTETEGAWTYRSTQHYGRPGVSYGSLLHDELGLTPVFLRYNTGLHVSDNGHRLAALLDRLVEAWPVPLRDLVLIGHSMGGLVARAALHAAGAGSADAAPWTGRVRDTVTLGTPHLGAPLERAAHSAGHLLARFPETAPLARLLRSRSAGIKDLRHGSVVEQDWSGRDLDSPQPLTPARVPLHDGARHFAILATLPRNPATRWAEAVGDLLVQPRSAYGDTGADDRLGYEPDRVLRLGGLHHFDLLNHPAVYARLRDWLAAGGHDAAAAPPAG